MMDMSKKAAIALGTGFEPVEALAPADVLRRAGVEVVLVSTDGNLNVEAAQGIKVIADAAIGDVDLLGFDALVIPGGSGGVKSLKKCKPFLEAVKRFMIDGKPVAAICAGPTILADLGLLEGYTATCYPGCETDFPQGTYPEEQGVYQSRNLITASGPGWSLPFGREIARVLVGDRKADAVASDMLF